MRLSQNGRDALEGGSDSHVFNVGHEAFWEALAREDLSDEARSEIETGLYLLRHFEFIYLPQVAGNEEAEYRLKNQVRNVTNKEARQVLSDVLMSMWVGEYVTVPPAIVTYANFLQQRGQWALAHAVWDTAIFAWKSGHQETTRECIEARLNRAVAARNISRYEESLRDYVVAQDLAAEAGYHDMQLRAIIGGSLTIADNGSPQLALMMIRDAAHIARLTGAVRHEIVARLTYGSIYQNNGKADQALLEFSLAFELASEANDEYSAQDMEHALMNIAACAADFGYWDLACNTNELIAASSKSTYVRSYALCNLIELYAWMKNRTGFERACKMVNDMSVEVQVKAYSKLYELRGLYRFGQTQSLMDKYAEGAEAIYSLGVRPAYDAAQADIDSLSNGKPVGEPTVVEQPLPLALKRLHHLLQTHLARAVA